MIWMNRLTVKFGSFAEVLTKARNGIATEGHLWFHAYKFFSPTADGGMQGYMTALMLNITDQFAFGAEGTTPRQCWGHSGDR